MSGQRKKNRILAVAGHDYPEIRELVDTYISFDLDAPKDNISRGICIFQSAMSRCLTLYIAVQKLFRKNLQAPYAFQSLSAINMRENSL